ncbi:hypothetical protein FORC53_0596 [Vibrio vulnificus]|uniref:Uncharacterized protein n=1 Tax=Vibrio vulnificus TaxID=672 RepID=A0AAN1PLV6_VIBVL|nr:hypothetical protein FORC53_0596 [Vibrio vulnificus]
MAMRIKQFHRFSFLALDLFCTEHNCAFVQALIPSLYTNYHNVLTTFATIACALPYCDDCPFIIVFYRR